MEEQQSSQAEFVTIDAQAAEHMLNSGHRYIDVRVEEVFNKGHVENAINIPYFLETPQGRVKNPKFLEQVLSICNKEDNLIVGCQTGRRSVSATKDLLNADFKHVYNMGGGYNAWVEHSTKTTNSNDQN